MKLIFKLLGVAVQAGLSVTIFFKKKDFHCNP